MERQKRYNRCGKDGACADCAQNGRCAAWVSFVERHGAGKGYAHFDRRVSLAMDSVRDYCMDREKVAAHGFYPFIHFQQKRSRYGRKGPKKPRELYYCSHMDRCIYQRYAFLLNDCYNRWVREKGIDRAATAYRSDLGKNNIDFAKEVFDAMRKMRRCLVIVGDFTDFFDRLDHRCLKERLCELLDVACLPEDYFAVFRNVTRFAWWDWEDIVKAAGESVHTRGIKKKLNRKETLLTRQQFLDNRSAIRKNTSGAGIPQGAPISAVLANIYMLRFDQSMQAYVSAQGGIYRRYSDDFLIALPLDREEEAERHIDAVFSRIREMDGLVALQEEKTSRYLLKQGRVFSYPSNTPAFIDYLGFWFDGEAIRLRPRSITKYYYRMRRKARTIGQSGGRSPHGRQITARNLYRIYSHDRQKRTFIDYAGKARKALKLRDPETDAVIKRHKQKIAQAVKAGRRKDV